MSLGGGSQKTSSSTVSKGTGIDPTQAGFLNDLWGRGQATLNGQQGYGPGGVALQQGADWARQGAGFLTGPHMQQVGESLNQLQNPEVDPMMGVYGRQVGQQFNEQILPGLRGGAMVNGGYGGSRAGIAEGLAGARSSQQLQDFAAQLYGQGQDRKLAAAQTSGQLGLGINEGFQGNAANAMDLGRFGMGLPWYNMQQYSGLLGSPVTIDKGGSSKSKGKGFDASVGFPV